MPELPEVETIARQLAAAAGGFRWTRVITRPCSLYRTPAADVARRLTGARLAGVARRGKVLLLRFDQGLTLLAHLGMSGQWLLVPPAVPGPGHRHLIAELEDGRTLILRDPRRFGFLKLVATGEVDGQPELHRVGADPLDPGRTWEDFLRTLKTRGGAVKPLLLTQALFAGIGNVYADEILFAARVRPMRPVTDLSSVEQKELFHGIRTVLSQAVADGGTSFDDVYTDLYGRPGLFGGRLNVYGREGEPCPRCHIPLAAAVSGGRASVYCPHCQK